MATVTTHLLNSVTGDHAAGVRADLYRIDAAGTRTALFSAVTDAGGRLRATVTPDMAHADTETACELVLHIAEYFARQPVQPGGMRILREAVVRFVMPDPEGAYHIPMMLAPNSYSLWCSN